MNLRFDKFIKVEHGYLIFPTPEEKFKTLDGIYDRTCAVIYMASNINSPPIKYGVSKEATQAAFVRAALGELVALEEFIDKEYCGIEKSAYKIYKTDEPILHMAKLLRNFNIHVSSSLLAQKTMMVQVNTISENDSAFEIDITYISNLDPSGIRKLSSSKDYSDNQIDEMVRVFEEQQHEFGISTLLMKIALSYIERFEPYLTTASWKHVS